MVTMALLKRCAALLAVFMLFVCAAGMARAAPTVTAGDTRLVVEIEAGSETPYVGEMILVTITGYYDVTIALEKFEWIELPNFTWIQLERDIWSRKRVDGREFKTMERKLALYPQKPGLQTIGPFRHNLTLMEGKSERFAHEVVSNAVSLEIQRKPQTNGGWWFPAEDVILSDEWDMDPAQLANGATATRTIRITAYGQPGEMLPNPPYMSAPWLISFIAPEKRSTEITREGPVGTVEWQWKLRPSDSEPGQIRAFRIPWFDTTSRNMRELVIPSQRVAFAAIGQEPQKSTTGSNLAKIALPIVLGLLVPVTATLPGRRFKSARTIVAWLRSRLPNRRAWALRIALWRGDRSAYRRHAAFLARRSGEPIDELLADLDRSLYAKATVRRETDLKSIHRRIARAGGFRCRHDNGRDAP